MMKRKVKVKLNISDAAILQSVERMIKDNLSKQSNLIYNLSREEKDSYKLADKQSEYGETCFRILNKVRNELRRAKVKERKLIRNLILIQSLLKNARNEELETS